MDEVVEPPKLAEASRTSTGATLSSPVPERSSRRTRRRARWWDYIFADVCAIALTAVMGSGIAAIHSGEGLAPRMVVYALVVTVVCIVINALKGAYSQLELRPGDPATTAFSGIFNSASVAAWGSFVVFDTITTIPLSAPVAIWLLAVPIVSLSRTLIRQSWTKSVDRAQRTLILGAGEVGRLLAHKIQAHPESGMKIVGFVDAQPLAADKNRARDLGPVLGTPNEIAQLIEDHDVDRVIVAFSVERHDQLLELIRRLVDLGVDVDLVPRLFEIVNADVPMGSIEGMPLLTVPTFHLSPLSQLVKRAFDIVVAAFLLLFLLPCFALIALAIKADSPGPVFFRQERIGSKGPFTIFKFRSMYDDADAMKHRFAHLNLYLAEHGDSRMFKIEDDPRVTRIGTLIRRYFADELPQIFNVLRGDMSLVGPRPLIPAEDQHVMDWQRRRLAIKPGITGLWQVLGSNEIPFDEMVKLDYLYVSGWSVSKDIRLLLQTVPAVFRRRYY
jgi:exopolysaccharide biosynthesis polyprenyl glycosylphosphotransferase